MKGQILKISKSASKKTGGTAHLVIIKCEDGVSRRAWVDTGYNNFNRWKNILTVGNTLDNLGLTKDKLYIDADCYPRVIGKGV